MSSTQRAQDLLAKIAAERAASTQFRTIGGVAVLIAFLGFAGIVYSKITQFDTNTLMAELQKNASRTVWPMVYKELDKVGKEALPAVSKAVSSEVANLGPTLTTRLDSESKIFQVNMARKMKTSLDANLTREFDDNKDKLKGHLKPFTSDDAAYDDLVRKLRKAGQDWAQAKLDTTFTEHVKLLQSINETVQELGEQSRKGEASAESMDDVMLVVAEILNARVNEEQ